MEGGRARGGGVGGVWTIVRRNERLERRKTKRLRKASEAQQQDQVGSASCKGAAARFSSFMWL